MRRKKQTKLESYAAVVTQKPFNAVWFPLFKGILWTGCAGYMCCLKVALRRILFVPWGKKYSSLKSLSLMFHVHTGELTEGRWVGKADLNFIDWTEEKYQAVNHRWGVLDRWVCFSFAFLGFPYLLCINIYWFQNKRGLTFWNVSRGASFQWRNCFFFSLNYRKIECEVILYNSTKHFVNSIWKCLCHMCLFLVHVSWVLNLLFVSNRKWQEATQQIQTLQASQSLLAEYEQKIKVRHWGLYEPCVDFP